MELSFNCITSFIHLVILSPLFAQQTNISSVQHHCHDRWARMICSGFAATYSLWFNKSAASRG